MLEAYAKHDRVILEPLGSTETTYGRVVVSDLGKEKADQYIIRAVGPGVMNPFTHQFTETQYKVGERVLVKKALIHELDIEGNTYFVTRDQEILCGLKETEDDVPA